MDLNGLSDGELLVLYRQQHDVRVAAVLFDRYAGMIYGVCLKYFRDRDASKDAAMDIFERIVDALKVHEVLNFKSWLYVTSRNHCLMKLRAARTHPSTELSPFLMESGNWVHQDEEPREEANLVKLEECIEKLEGKQKTCIQLFYLEQKSYAQICSLTGLAYKAVKSHVQNGKRNLKICIENNARQ